MKKHFLLSICLAASSFSYSQNTFEQIYGIFQANCTVGCHSGASPDGNLNLNESGDMAAVYNNLIGTNPVNPTAVAKGYKLVDPGYPERSFLLRKCATQDWDAAISIEVSEGNNMPDGPGTLDKEEIELIRQWINFNAPETGQVIDPQIINDYYNGLGTPRIEIPLTPEEQGLEGFQIHMGPFFLPPLAEVEYRWKYDTKDPNPMEVYRTESFINNESHHFILYKFGNGQANNFQNGFRPATQGDLFSFNIDQVTAWQDPGDNHLPEKTAYKWDANTVLDNNYHILNYSDSTILPAEAYINVYTQEAGTADVEMLSVLLPINIVAELIPQIEGNIGDSLIIPNDGIEHTFTDVFAIPISIPDWYIWSIFGHTHSRGTDYDVYLRNANGTKGEQIYEGFYNTDYTFNQGYFSWEHPALRKFDPLLQINMTTGFIQEAKYINNSNDTIRWGLTTEDEMMLIAVQYTEAPIPADTTDGIDELTMSYLSVNPNPFNQSFTAFYKLSQPAKVSVDLYDIYGRLIQNIESGEKPSGQNKLEYNLGTTPLANGTYLLRFTVNDKTTTRRLVHTGGL